MKKLNHLLRNQSVELAKFFKLAFGRHAWIDLYVVLQANLENRPKHSMAVNSYRKYALAHCHATITQVKEERIAIEKWEGIAEVCGHCLSVVIVFFFFYCSVFFNQFDTKCLLLLPAVLRIYKQTVASVRSARNHGRCCLLPRQRPIACRPNIEKRKKKTI